MEVGKEKKMNKYKTICIIMTSDAWLLVGCNGRNSIPNE